MGFHRLAAFTEAGFAEAPCDVRLGGLREAILHSAGANATHGVRRSNADKRRAVMLLLEDAEWGRWSAREIARRCSVHHELVGRLRAEVTGGTASEERTYQDRHGNITRMRTERIGRQADAAPPERPPAAEPAPHLPDAGNVVRLRPRYCR